MVDRRSDIADTVRRRIVSGLHRGTLAAGSRLPSTRAIAEEFDVAPRTAMAAYRLLEVEGLVELRKRSGIYVAASRPTGGAILTQLAGWVVEVLLDARAREIAPIEFPDRVRRCLETLRLRAACIADNEDQLDQIRHELRDDYGIEAEGLEPDRLAAPDAEARHRLARADLLVSTSLHSAAAHRAAAWLGKSAFTVTLRADYMAELNRGLDRGPVYFVASDPRFRDALRAVFEPTGSGHNARALIVGEDDLDVIPDSAPTYIMRLAHERLGDTPLTRRIVPLRRVFSTQMARDLLTFVIRANIAAMGTRPS